MKLHIHHHCTDFDSYRAARVKSLFNVDSGAIFSLEVDLPIEDGDWQIGVIVGPSGSGKTSLGRKLGALYQPDWPTGQPIIDAIAPDGDFNTATGALSAVGLGSVPTWLRPFPVLSNGEQFRASLARLICEAPERAVVDEFSSVVDRQIARVGAGAFAKAWRRTGKQVVLLSCHYDILDWVQPDWVLDTATGHFERGRLWRRPRLDMQIQQTDWRYWPLFEPHHYLKLPRMIAATCYVASIDGEPVAHLAVSTRPGLVEARACRLVVMPEWQGAGVGLRFLNGVCELWRQGVNRYHKPMPTLFHTSHPGLAAALRRDSHWTQVSATLFGDNKARGIASLVASRLRSGKPASGGSGYGGHFRAVQGFRYLGEAACAS
ncbi:GNAT family N-acetyltransferase [Laribacter hongkongensis]|uniref:ABC transporter ATP-binding protein n=1 Tax=Laribacter hongkongensis TaxID=168471 RepID=A0A248LI62_9NEIS|nr:GNAT family N-acetyltransferase [Laribacter hongkongensis]ASJ24171.1 ABC transporter ATP-binding protein [Laribacter hongkongensis]MCG9058200.1 ABC transporter ATP-binding protein [Laribacter hongkongensis]MCG9088069.1 ABC transporter ATP-binding protein [Laribacter hongkongensis]MCG9110376.1 ABC transporter ATP-binding protein [Laribacter hongkongensis]MCG9121511.1 ABC transporter ATP-binding protein [Laribacter hongkongensis]